MARFRLVMVAVLILCGIFAARASIRATATPATILCDTKGRLLLPLAEPAAHTTSVQAQPLYL